ncbi:DsbA family protein [Mesorhizobium sp. B2-3-13]|uniref:DsbA family protein n=1 Tax=Mesorhizobium sp. B2-3-13 TaxID=2589951 RepID=UPI001129C948|nr:DsbA family protein [Mesorhizobium sp. B2-3-13]TPL75232.1 DsbA family protein [Mesorhizobium sp. B2-3-13]
MGESENQASPEPRPNNTPVLEISYFTDPLCCWSWGFEPQLRRLRYGFAGRIALRLRLGGMIGSWDRFSDPLNDVHRPAQMGPIWIQAARITGMPFEPTIWARDPPASSWPSCLAVKAAGLQSAAAADLYLRRIREAVMVEGRNIAKEEVLADIAHELAKARPDLLEPKRLELDATGAEARAALEEDVREARFRGVGRFPCLSLSRPGADRAWIVGWLPWDELLARLLAYAPDVGAAREPPSAEAYTLYWGGMTPREAEGTTGNPDGTMANKAAFR